MNIGYGAQGSCDSEYGRAEYHRSFCHGAYLIVELEFEHIIRQSKAILLTYEAASGG